MISRLEPQVFPPEEAFAEDSQPRATIEAPFPGVAIGLVLAPIVVGTGLAVGTRYGWTWGLAAGLLAWGVAPALLMFGLCVASAGGRRD